MSFGISTLFIRNIGFNGIAKQEADRIHYAEEHQLLRFTTLEIMTKKPKTKCDCGELAKDHFQGVGQCSKNGCTWYHPNVNYIRRQKKK